MVKYHTEAEYINKQLSAIARNTKTPVKEVIHFFEVSLSQLDNNKRKALISTHNFYRRWHWHKSRAKERFEKLRGR